MNRQYEPGYDPDYYGDGENTMTTQHTPGPWTHHAGSKDVVGPNHQLVAVCETWGDAAIEQEVIANARLIASAPDLLAALEMVSSRADVVRPLEISGRTMEVVRAAIAKAKADQ